MTELRSRVVWLGLQTTLLIVALLAVVGGVALAVYERAEHVDAQERMHSAINRLAPDRTPTGVWVVDVGPDGAVRESPGLPRGLDLDSDRARVAADGRPRQEEVETADGIFFVRTERHGDSLVQVVMDRTAEERAGDRVVTALLLAGATGAVLTGLVAGLLARRTLRPVAEALALQRRFVSDAGHELRTPLTLLSTRVQLLARKLDSGAEVRSEVDGVLADTAALNEVLEDLLVVAHAGEVERTTCDLATLAAGCVDAARAAAAQRGVDLQFLGNGPAPADVGEPAVRRAVTSLVDNALDHASSRVEVSVRPSPRRVEVEVADDGPGVAPEVADRLFERFASDRAGRGDRTGTRRRHYGLGLALVADVAAAHRGSVRLQPREHGTAFVLTLPR